MKIGVVISTNDPETCWNAIRFANFALSQKDAVKIFLMGKGVECEIVSSEKFNTIEQMKKFIEGQGKVLACGTCIKSRGQDPSSTCPVNSMNDFYEIIKESDKVVTF